MHLTVAGLMEFTVPHPSPPNNKHFTPHWTPNCSPPKLKL